MTIGLSTRKKLVRFVERFHEVYLIERKPPKRKMWSREGWQKFKRQPDQIMYGQKYGPKLVKPLRIEKSARRLRGIYSFDPDDPDHKETLKNARRNLERRVAAVMPCERRAPNGITNVFAQSGIASEKTPKTIYGCAVESHDSTRQRVESSQPEKWWGPHCRQRIYFDDTSQFGAQVYSDAAGDEHPGCEGSSGQGMEEARKDSSMEAGESQE